MHTDLILNPWVCVTFPLGMLVAGIVTGFASGHLLPSRRLLDRMWDDGYAAAEADLRREYEPDPAVVTEIVRRSQAGRGELAPEFPDWDDDTLARLRGEGPGEITGPFLITDVPPGTVRRQAAGKPGSKGDAAYEPAGGHHQLGERFTDLTMPTEAELEQEWSWGKVIWEILEFRAWLESDAWNIPLPALVPAA